MNNESTLRKIFLYVVLITISCNKHSYDGGALKITSFSPAKAAMDSTVVIHGTNFSTSGAGNIVTINGIPATVISASSTSISVKVPAHAGTGKISVIVNGKKVSSLTDLIYLYTVVTLAGDGMFGFRDGAGPDAEFNSPNSIAYAGAGNLYVADVINNRIRKISPTGFVNTLAGDGSKTFKDGQGADAAFYYPYGVAVSGSTGIAYVADANNNRIRKVTAAGEVSTLAGDGIGGYKEGTGTDARFKNSEGVAVDVSGNVYVADTYNNRIRKITPAREVSTLAGDGTYGYKEGVGNVAQFSFPTGVAVDVSGNVYVADNDNNRIRKITPAGEVSTLAGDGTAGFNDGPGIHARFNNPGGIAVDSLGNVYVAEYINNRIRKISPDGIVSTLAGDGNPGYKDALGPDAEFNYPSGIVVDPVGDIYVVDAGNYRIRILW